MLKSGSILRIRRNYKKLARESRFLMELFNLSLEDCFGIFALFDEYQEFYGKDAAIGVFDFLSTDDLFTFYTVVFNFRREVLKAASNRCRFKLDEKIISQNCFDLNIYDKSDFESETAYYQIREELIYFDVLIWELLFKEKRRFRTLPRSLENSQFYLTVLFGCNLEVLTGMFELFDKFQEFYGESFEEKLLEFKLRPDLPNIIFKLLSEVLNKPFENKNSKIINPFSLIKKYLQNLDDFDFFKGLVNKKIVQKLENFKRENTIYFQLFGGGHPVVSDFQKQDAIELIKDKAQVVIKEEKISLRFRDTSTPWVVLECERKGGFTRLDLFELILKEYKRAISEQEPVCYHRLGEILVKGVFYNSPMSLYDVIAENK